jgi:hypothetical protein
MAVNEITHEVRLQQWEGIVRECRSSGKTIKAWCSKNSINIKTYYRWQQLVCQATCQELSVVKETEPQAAQQFRWLMEGLSIEQPKAHKKVSEVRII